MMQDLVTRRNALKGALTAGAVVGATQVLRVEGAGATAPTGIVTVEPGESVATALTSLGQLGGVLYLAPGDHEISTTLEVDVPTVVRGAGRGATRVRWDPTATTTADLFTVTSSFAAFEDLSLTPPDQHRAIQLDGTSDLLVDRVSLTLGAGSTGVEVDAGGSVAVLGCLVSGGPAGTPTGCGVRIAANTGSVTIDGNDFRDLEQAVAVGTAGASFATGPVTIVQNTVRGTSAGTRMYVGPGAVGASVAYNSIRAEGDGRDGIRVAAERAGITGNVLEGDWLVDLANSIGALPIAVFADGVVVSHNRVANTAPDIGGGILIAGSTCLVTGNVVTVDAGVATSILVSALDEDLQLAGTADGNVIEANRLDAPLAVCGRAGDSCHRNVVAGNVLRRGATRYPLRIKEEPEATGTQVLDNDADLPSASITTLVRHAAAGSPTVDAAPGSTWRDIASGRMFKRLPDGWVSIGDEAPAARSVSGPITIDVGDGAVQVLELTGDVTIDAIVGAVDGAAASVTLLMTQPASPAEAEVLWTADVRWSDGYTPRLSRGEGALDVVSLLSADGGATWCGFVAGIDMKAPTP